MVSGFENLPYEERLKHLNLTTPKIKRIHDNSIKILNCVCSRCVHKRGHDSDGILLCWSQGSIGEGRASRIGQ